MPGATRVNKRGKLLRFSVNHSWPVLRKHPRAQFLEFGVHKGKDLCLIDRMVRQKESEPNTKSTSLAPSQRVPVVLHGFDSFRGLPEQWDNGQRCPRGSLLYSRGKFDLGGVPPCLKRARADLGFPDDDGAEEHIRLHTGWFDDTVPPFFDTHPYPVAYCHADAGEPDVTK